MAEVKRLVEIDCFLTTSQGSATRDRLRAAGPNVSSVLLANC